MQEDAPQLTIAGVNDTPDENGQMEPRTLNGRVENGRDIDGNGQRTMTGFGGGREEPFVSGGAEGKSLSGVKESEAGLPHNRTQRWVNENENREKQKEEDKKKEIKIERAKVIEKERENVKDKEKEWESEKKEKMEKKKAIALPLINANQDCTSERLSTSMALRRLLTVKVRRKRPGLFKRIFNRILGRKHKNVPRVKFTITSHVAMELKRTLLKSSRRRDDVVGQQGEIEDMNKKRRFWRSKRKNTTATKGDKSATPRRRGKEAERRLRGGGDLVESLSDCGALSKTDGLTSDKPHDPSTKPSVELSSSPGVENGAGFLPGGMSDRLQKSQDDHNAEKKRFVIDAAEVKRWQDLENARITEELEQKRIADKKAESDRLAVIAKKEHKDREVEALRLKQEEEARIEYERLHRIEQDRIAEEKRTSDAEQERLATVFRKTGDERIESERLQTIERDPLAAIAKNKQEKREEQDRLAALKARPAISHFGKATAQQNTAYEEESPLSKASRLTRTKPEPNHNPSEVRGKDVSFQPFKGVAESRERPVYERPGVTRRTDKEEYERLKHKEKNDEVRRKAAERKAMSQYDPSSGHRRATLDVAAVPAQTGAAPAPNVSKPVGATLIDVGQNKGKGSAVEQDGPAMQPSVTIMSSKTPTERRFDEVPEEPWFENPRDYTDEVEREMYQQPVGKLGEHYRNLPTHQSNVDLGLSVLADSTQIKPPEEEWTGQEKRPGVAPSVSSHGPTESQEVIDDRRGGLGRATDEAKRRLDVGEQRIEVRKGSASTYMSALRRKHEEEPAQPEPLNKLFKDKRVGEKGRTECNKPQLPGAHEGGHASIVRLEAEKRPTRMEQESQQKQVRKAGRTEKKGDKPECSGDEAQTRPSEVSKEKHRPKKGKAESKTPEVRPECNKEDARREVLNKVPKEKHHAKKGKTESIEPQYTPQAIERTQTMPVQSPNISHFSNPPKSGSGQYAPSPQQPQLQAQPAVSPQPAGPYSQPSVSAGISGYSQQQQAYLASTGVSGSSTPHQIQPYGSQQRNALPKCEEEDAHSKRLEKKNHRVRTEQGLRTTKEQEPLEVRRASAREDGVEKKKGNTKSREHELRKKHEPEKSHSKRLIKAPGDARSSIDIPTGTRPTTRVDYNPLNYHFADKNAKVAADYRSPPMTQQTTKYNDNQPERERRDARMNIDISHGTQPTTSENNTHYNRVNHGSAGDDFSQPTTSMNSTDYNQLQFASAGDNFSQPTTSMNSTDYKQLQFASAGGNFSQPTTSMNSTDYNQLQFASAGGNFSQLTTSMNSTDYKQLQFASAGNSEKVAAVDRTAKAPEVNDTKNALKKKRDQGVTCRGDIKVSSGSDQLKTNSARKNRETDRGKRRPIAEQSRKKGGTDSREVKARQKYKEKGDRERLEAEQREQEQKANQWSARTAVSSDTGSYYRGSNESREDDNVGVMHQNMAMGIKQESSRRSHNLPAMSSYQETPYTSAQSSSSMPSVHGQPEMMISQSPLQSYSSASHGSAGPSYSTYATLSLFDNASDTTTAISGTYTTQQGYSEPPAIGLGRSDWSDRERERTVSDYRNPGSRDDAERGIGSGTGRYKAAVTTQDRADSYSPTAAQQKTFKGYLDPEAILRGTAVSREQPLYARKEEREGSGARQSRMGSARVTESRTLRSGEADERGSTSSRETAPRREHEEERARHHRVQRPKLKASAEQPQSTYSIGKEHIGDSNDGFRSRSTIGTTSAEKMPMRGSNAAAAKY